MEIKSLKEAKLLFSIIKKIESYEKDSNISDNIEYYSNLKKINEEYNKKSNFYLSFLLTFISLTFISLIIIIFNINFELIENISLRYGIFYTLILSIIMVPPISIFNIIKIFSKIKKSYTYKKNYDNIQKFLLEEKNNLLSSKFKDEPFYQDILDYTNNKIITKESINIVDKIILSFTHEEIDFLKNNEEALFTQKHEIFIYIYGKIDIFTIEDINLNKDFFNEVLSNQEFLNSDSSYVDSYNSDQVIKINSFLIQINNQTNLNYLNYLNIENNLTLNKIGNF